MASLDPEVLRRLPRDAFWPGVMAFAASVCHELDDHARAAALHEVASPHANLCLFDAGGVFLGSMHLHLGLLAEVLENDAAASHFRAAAEIHRRLDASTWWDRCSIAALPAAV